MLDTYEHLQTAILGFLGRQDDQENIPVADCIRLFEVDASRKLKTHFQEVSEDITTEAGTASYDLPDDFYEAVEVSLIAATSFVLEYMSPAQLDDTWGQPTQGMPVNFTIQGSSIRFGPVPDTIYTVRISYFSSIPPLSDTNTSNWLLDNYADAYLFGALAEAELGLGADNSDVRYTVFVQRREAAYEQIMLQDRKYRTGSAPLVMRPDPRVVF